MLSIVLDQAADAPADGVVLGPGDDLAALRFAGGELLFGVDQIVDGLHVNAATHGWRSIGWKAACRSLSDVAAMGGQPRAMTASVVLPTTAHREQVTELRDGLRAAGEACGAPLVGGDISIHQVSEGPLCVSVAVVGQPGPAGPVPRHGGQAGDLLVATGAFGGSLHADGGGHHMDFTPRIREGEELASRFGASLHALIDVSDGLGRDVARLGEASGAQAVLEASAIPIRGDCGLQAAISDGEDYELVAAVDPGVTIPSQCATGCPLTVIGALRPIQEGAPWAILRDPSGCETDVSRCGWDHGR